MQVQKEVLTWEDKSLSGQSPFTKKGNPLNWTKMWSIDVLFARYWVSNLAPIPQSQPPECPCPQDGYWTVAGPSESRWPPVAILIQLITPQTLLTEHGSQVLFCVANDQQRSPNISPASKASFQSCIIITKHGKLCILSSHRVRAKLEKYSPTNYARSFWSYIWNEWLYIWGDSLAVNQRKRLIWFSFSFFQSPVHLKIYRFLMRSFLFVTPRSVRVNIYLMKILYIFVANRLQELRLTVLEK